MCRPRSLRGSLLTWQEQMGRSNKKRGVAGRCSSWWWVVTSRDFGQTRASLRRRESDRSLSCARTRTPATPGHRPSRRGLQTCGAATQQNERLTLPTWCMFERLYCVQMPPRTATGGCLCSSGASVLLCACMFVLCTSCMSSPAQ